MVKGKNTVDFKPRYDPPDLRLIPAPQHWKQYKRPYSDQYVFWISFSLINLLELKPPSLEVFRIFS